MPFQEDIFVVRNVIFMILEIQLINRNPPQLSTVQKERVTREQKRPPCKIATRLSGAKFPTYAHTKTTDLLTTQKKVMEIFEMCPKEK